MAKKKRRQDDKKKVKSWLWIVIAVVIAAAGIVAFSMDRGVEAKGKSFYVKGGETRPVLDPSLFTGMTRAAYAAAKKYPQILDKVYCYCYCDEPPFYHKSLLSCFVTDHGAG